MRIFGALTGFCLLFAAGSASAGDSDYILDITEAGGDRLTEATVAVMFSNGGDAVTGYSFGVCHDEDQLEISSGDVADGDDVEDLDVLFQAVKFYTSGWTVGVLLEVNPTESIPPGDDYELYLATYELVGVGEGSLTFCEMGDPVVANHVLANGQEIEPELLAGEIDIYDPDAPYSFRAESKTIFYNADSGVDTVDVELSIAENETNFGFPTETRGFAFGLEHDPDVLAVASVDMRGELLTMNSGGGPDYFGANLEPSEGAGFTLGVIYEFEGDANIEFDPEKVVVEVAYDVDSSLLIGNNHGLTTELSWSNHLADPPVTNTVYVGSTQVTELNLIDGRLVFDVPGDDEPLFKRGDVNGNGSFLALGDALYLLAYGFTSGPEPPCMDAADLNDNGTIDLISDSLFLLAYAFTGGTAPAAPGADDCGPDETDDATGCDDPPDICG